MEILIALGGICFTVLFVFVLRIALKYFIGKCPILRKKPLKYLIDSNTWLIAITIIITTMILFSPDFWVERVVNHIIPKSVWGRNSAELDQGAGSRGDTFGGAYGPLIGWFAAIVTFAAFWVQYKANEQQKKLNKKQRKEVRIEHFENRFFKFIDYHRDNVSQIKYADPKRHGQNLKNRTDNPVEFIEGNRGFRRIADEIRELLIAAEYQKLETLEKKYKKINFIYFCVFFGASKNSLQILKEKFGANQDFTFGGFSSKQTKYNYKIKYYGGHTRHIGHCFRNIYQAVKYVDKQKFLSPKQKYDYVTILRAQMSHYEQEVFFYSTLSELGSTWEWKHLFGKKNPLLKQRDNQYDKLWITKYDFLRNIVLNSNGKIAGSGVNIKDFYPLINLEGENEFEQIGVLPFDKNKTAICRYCFNKKHIKYYKKKDLASVEEEIVSLYKDKKIRLNCENKGNCEVNIVLEKNGL